MATFETEFLKTFLFTWTRPCVKATSWT